ncbi:MAG: hypothetical protein L6Q38_08975 [Nitrospira sp.]|nr:hypothetical protein [Nitrospira sp.]
MRTIFSVLSFIAILAALACAILLVAWPVSLFAGWLFGLDPFHAAALALGSFLVLAVFFAAAVSERASVPWGGMADWLDTVPEREADGVVIDADAPGDSHWFAPCQCDSGKPFARCCGKRAFKRAPKGVNKG